MPFSKYLISWYIWFCIADNNSPSLSPPSGAQAPPLCGWLPWLPVRLGSSPTSHPTSSMSTRRLKTGQWGESSFPSNLWNLLFSCSHSVFHFVILYLFINYMYIAIFCHGTSLKTLSGDVGTRTCVAGLSQQTCSALDHHASPKKDASSPELKQHCLFPFVQS